MTLIDFTDPGEAVQNQNWMVATRCVPWSTMLTSTFPASRHHFSMSSGNVWQSAFTSRTATDALLLALMAVLRTGRGH